MSNQTKTSVSSEATSTTTMTHSDSDILGREVSTSSSDILNELYCYIIRQREVSAATLQVQHVIDTLLEEGIWFWRDRRFLESWNVLMGWLEKQPEDGVASNPYTGEISKEAQLRASKLQLDSRRSFTTFVAPCARIFLKAFSEELVIPDWQTFTADMQYLFHDTKRNTSGQNAQYIPVLAQANSNQFGLSVCSIDGQRLNIGDATASFSLQSVSKPVTYAMCLQEEGHDFVDEWIGVEPAGRPFNTQDLEPDTNNPFNSSVNSGAIMACGVYASHFTPTTSWRDIVDQVRSKWRSLCGRANANIGFSQETYESEKATAYNNFAIAYNLKGRRGLPRDVDLQKMLDVYLGCCSIEITCEALAVAAATLANGGICPITGVEVFPASVTRTVLSEVMTCGMYDQAGHFAVEVGLPSKSGVSGALLVMVPNVFGFATFSPRLNSKGNSVRGIEFCRKLVSLYRVHLFEPLRSGNTGAKIDPRRNGSKEEQDQTSRMAWGVQVGDKYALQLRDVFLFALAQVALASPPGLSEYMVDLIRKKHRDVYQSSVDEAHLANIIQAVEATPGELIYLQDLTKDIWILDSHRTIILMALMDIILIDGCIGDYEKSVAVRIAGILGVDEDVALLELNRYNVHCDAHRNRGDKYQSMLDSIGVAERSATMLSRALGSGEEHEDIKRAVGSSNASHGSSVAEENAALKLEVRRLRRKVHLLSEMLDSNSGDAK